jgi:hypothetical protein
MLRLNGKIIHFSSTKDFAKASLSWMQMKAMKPRTELVAFKPAMLVDNLASPFQWEGPAL